MTWAVPVVKADSSRGEVDRQRGDLLGAAQAAHRLARDEGRVHLVDGLAARRGLLGHALAQRRRLHGAGQIALQRMPRVTKSAATALVRPITAALVVP